MEYDGEDVVSHLSLHYEYHTKQQVHFKATMQTPSCMETTVRSVKWFACRKYFQHSPRDAARGSAGYKRANINVLLYSRCPMHLSSCESTEVLSTTRVRRDATIL